MQGSLGTAGRLHPSEKGLTTDLGGFPPRPFLLGGCLASMPINSLLSYNKPCTPRPLERDLTIRPRHGSVSPSSWDTLLDLQPKSIKSRKAAHHIYLGMQACLSMPRRPAGRPTTGLCPGLAGLPNLLRKRALVQICKGVHLLRAVQEQGPGWSGRQRREAAGGGACCAGWVSGCHGLNSWVQGGRGRERIKLKALFH